MYAGAPPVPGVRQDYPSASSVVPKLSAVELEQVDQARLISSGQLTQVLRSFDRLPSLELLERGTTFLAGLLFDLLEDPSTERGLDPSRWEMSAHPHDLRQANARVKYASGLVSMTQSKILYPCHSGAGSRRETCR